MAFRIVRNDITKVKADAIVNTANPEPVYMEGTDSAIYNAAGAERLLKERKKAGRIEEGEVAVTPAFDLDAKYIFHTVGPVWNGGNEGEREIVRNCYLNCLNKAKELELESIAFPLISTGIYGFLMNVIATCAFAVPATLIYKKKKTKTGALVGLCVGVVSMVVCMLLWNYILTPLYMKVDRSIVV